MVRHLCFGHQIWNPGEWLPRTLWARSYLNRSNGIVGTDPKNLRVLVIFGLQSVFAAVAASSEGAGAARRLFDGADTTGEIRFTSVRPRRKQKRRILFTFGMSCPRDHRKRQSERSPARSGIYRAKRSYPLRTVISFCRLAFRG